MGQVVYADLFFLINFSMDFLCLFLSAKILGRHFSVLRGIAGAVIGGIYANVALLLPISGGWSFLLDGAVAAVMCAVSFYERSRRSFWLTVPVMIAVSMALGGFMTALFYLLNRSPLVDTLLSEGIEGDGLSVWVFALLAVISGAITLLGGRFFRRRSAHEWADIEIRYGGRTVLLHAMTDSGNLLREPISGRACIVADLRAVEKILPAAVVNAARSTSLLGEGIAFDDGARLRLVPTRTASGTGMLVAVRPERVVVIRGHERHAVDALIALTDLGTSAEGRDALLPSCLL